MLRAQRGSYVCWRCSQVGLRTDRHISYRIHPTISTPLQAGCRAFSRRGLATVQHSGSQDEHSRGPGAMRTEKTLPIRESLMRWEHQNPSQVQEILLDHPMTDSGLSNSFTRPQNVTMATFDVKSPVFDGDEMGDLRSDDPMLSPGDMVELGASGSRRPMLAICLGRHNGHDHFYTSTGKWFSASGVTTLFVVNKFASLDEIQPIIDFLPLGTVPLETLNTLQEMGHAPSRPVAAKLLHKMFQFMQESEAVYQDNAGTLDASSSFIGDPVKQRYLTLHEIADLLLPAEAKLKGRFKPSSLYAVHRALLNDEIFFRPLKQTGPGRSYLFEISPLSEVRIIHRIEAMVREHGEAARVSYQSSTRQPVESTPFGRFIENAQKAIDRNRNYRPWTEHGVIGPLPLDQRGQKTPLSWSATDLEFIQFIELWAGFQKFPAYSRFQGFGSAILRALDRYQEADLTPTTGWTFLQEIQWITPWDVPSRYTVRFPNVEINRAGGFSRPDLGVASRLVKPDCFEGTRKDWTDTTVYCIDSEETMDVDDGVSVESTSTPGQYWVHVHVADPASSLSPDGPFAKFAELIPQTLYLPGHFERMLPSELSQDHFSLGCDRRCLTFSALVDEESGTIEDQSITPGILRNVVSMTGEDVAAAIGEQRDDPETATRELLLGDKPEVKPPPRKMTRPTDLTPRQVEELSLLSRLGKVTQALRLEKGATPYYQPRPEVKVYFDSTTISEPKANESLIVTGDPAIHLGYSKPTATELVENAMRLAGEVAARWCHARGIPVPFKTQPHAFHDLAGLQQYTRDVFYPMLRAGIRPEATQWQTLLSFLGPDELSTTAGPHFSMGMDMYAKATSPLRRFSDLLVHWQVEAALLEEQRRGTSLVGNEDDSFLPFSRETMGRMLPLLRFRERQGRATQNKGTDQWILQALVRAWKFGEADLPETFEFTVMRRTSTRMVVGRLDWFDLQAIVRPGDLNDVLQTTEIRPGDVLAVKLQDVNVHTNNVYVEVVNVLQRVPSASIGVDGRETTTTPTEGDAPNQTEQPSL